jgi:predicted transcriptional regulator
MSITTTIHIPDELNLRIVSAAERAGLSTHSFILEALIEKTTINEDREQFFAEADARLARVAETGETIPWPDMRQYLEDRLAGKPVAPPLAKKSMV